jgi:hypothetical protein
MAGISMALMVCGVPKSGTTLLQRICNGHPAITITSESRVFAFPPAEFWRHARNIVGNTARRAWSGRRTRGLKWLPRFWVVSRYLYALSRRRLVVVDTAAREAALHTIFPRARVVGDKYPGYVFALDRHVSDDRLWCLVIYRDGRDVTSSTLKAVRSSWKDQQFVDNVDSVSKIAQRWAYGIEQMTRHEPLIHTVRYEDLVADPRRVMAAVGEWMDVDPTGFPLERVHEKSVGRYQEGLTADELATVCKVAGPTLARLGYL